MIRKRNGDTVVYDSQKIVFAVDRAFVEVTKKPNTVVAEAIAIAVTNELEERVAQNEDHVPSVEEIQDLVEQELMEAEFFTVAKAYIIYRFEHAKKRQNKKEEAQEKIKRSELLVEKRDGKKELFSLDKLKKALVFASREYIEEINVDAILAQCAREVYDGISTRDIARALVLSTRSYIERDPAYAFVASRLLLQNDIYKQVIDREPIEVGDFNARYRTAFKRNMERAVQIGIVDPRLLEFDFEKIATALKPERDYLLKYLGAQTLADRYFLRDRTDTSRHHILETPQMLWMRVAMGLAVNEKHREERALAFYEVLSQLRFVSSTPTLFNAGTTYPQLSSCYLGVTDDSLESIFKAFGDNAQLSKYAGGIGWSWSKIRSTGALVKTTDVDSNGVIPFLKIADSTTVAINRSGRRRGANCAYLETWHYDIEDFLELRKNTGDDRRRTHDMNTANWIPDLFMKRVEEDGEWTLFSPDEVMDLTEKFGSAFEDAYVAYEEKAQKGEMRTTKVIKARDLWKKMITQLFETGHPWITFKDPSNIRSPQDHVGVVHSSNLCTEITLNTKADEEVAVCNLGSVNLAEHMVDGKFDEARVEETVTTAMRMLDNVIDINFYPIPEAKNSNMRHRPVGLGVMGLQDALYVQNITFDSNEGVEFADYSMEVVSYHAIYASSKLAKERGAYESYKGSKWDRGIFPVDTLDLLEEERGIQVQVDRKSRLDWAPVREHVVKYGMRNSNCLAVAPTATISNISGCFPTIEPIYKNIYVKSNISGEFIIVNQYLVQDLKKVGMWNDEMLELIKGHDGGLSGISAIPSWIKERHKEVFEIDPLWLVKAAAHRGKWIDQSQSFNIFFKGTSGQVLSEVYMYAWKAGLKTTYYLRSLGASSIEKSTVSLENQERLDQDTVTSALHLAATNAVREKTEQVAKKGEKEIISSEESATSVTNFSSPNLCRIDDPDCEACQ
jgi:ribonucleoside-diphosphate reductase alpha chain